MNVSRLGAEHPMVRLANGIEVEGPIQAEVFVVWLNRDHLELTGPCGAAPWIIELGDEEHPVAVVDRMVRDVVGPPLLVHSTSWRRDHGAVTLSFVVVIDERFVGPMESAPIGRSELARSEATVAPKSIGHEQVIEQDDVVCAVWLDHELGLAGRGPVDIMEHASAHDLGGRRRGGHRWSRGRASPAAASRDQDRSDAQSAEQPHGRSGTIRVIEHP